MTWALDDRVPIQYLPGPQHLAVVTLKNHSDGIVMDQVYSIGPGNLPKNHPGRERVVLMRRTGPSTIVIGPVQRQYNVFHTNLVAEHMFIQGLQTRQEGDGYPAIPAIVVVDDCPSDPTNPDKVTRKLSIVVPHELMHGNLLRDVANESNLMDWDLATLLDQAPSLSLRYMPQLPVQTGQPMGLPKQNQWESPRRQR